MCAVEAVEDKGLFVGLGVKVLLPLAFCDGDTSVGVEGLFCLAVDGYSPDEPTNFLDFLDKVEVSDKGLSSLKEEFLFEEDCDFTAEGHFSERGDCVPFGDTGSVGGEFEAF